MRECLFGVAVGQRGIGKTYQTIKMIDEYVKGNPSKGVRPRRVLIFDVNNEYLYPTLGIEDVKKFSVHPTIQARRVTIYKRDGQNMNTKEMAATLGIILNDFRGGLLIVEDLNKYVSDSLPSDLIGKLCTLRHVDTDVIVHFQGLGRAGNPKILANMNWLRFHKTKDTVERHKNKFEDYYDILKIVENIIHTEYYSKKNERFFLYINFDRNKIRGTGLTEQMFRDAAFKYIGQNKIETIKPLMEEIGRDEKPVYKNLKEAMVAAEQTLFLNYFSK
jgi:hypothetical protein